MTVSTSCWARRRSGRSAGWRRGSEHAIANPVFVRSVWLGPSLELCNLLRFAHMQRGAHAMYGSYADNDDPLWRARPRVRYLLSTRRGRRVGAFVRL